MACKTNVDFEVRGIWGVGLGGPPVSIGPDRGDLEEEGIWKSSPIRSYPGAGLEPPQEAPQDSPRSDPRSHPRMHPRTPPVR